MIADLAKRARIEFSDVEPATCPTLRFRRFPPSVREKMRNHRASSLLPRKNLGNLIVDPGWRASGNF